MRRQLVPQAPEGRRFVGLDLLRAQLRHFPQQPIDLPLLAHDDVIQSVECVLGLAGLDFQVCQAAFGVFVHGWVFGALGGDGRRGGDRASA